MKHEQPEGCTPYLIDGVEFIDLTGEYEDLSHCDQCGDDISKYAVNIN